MIVSASAPGKVLIVGGYEIVESPNIGISVGVTARFTTVCNSYIVKELHNITEIQGLMSESCSCETTIQEVTNKFNLSHCKEVIKVEVHSPQFDQLYMFVTLVYKDMKTFTIQCKGERTPFLQNAIHFTIASTAIIKSGAHHEGAYYQNVKISSTNSSVPENSHDKCLTNTETLSDEKYLENEFSVTERTISLQLLADNDFYSQRNYLESLHLPVTVSNLRSLPVHLPLLGKISKTGLGSSASMTTSVVACLYYLLLGSVNTYRVIDNDNYNVKETIHRIAQIAHNISQGKIGSGFDVYTAVYGTSAYRRFPESKISMLSHQTSILQECKEGSNRQVMESDSKELKECLDLANVWVKHVPFSLPKGVHLILGDVHKGGSSTPGMVAKIMAWRRSEKVKLEGENSLWCKLSKSNEMYVSLFKALIEHERQCKEDYVAAIEKMQIISQIMIQSSQTKIEELFVEVARCANNCRRYLREIGNEAGVSVEPPELTKLLDETMTLPGVLAVGCPGAGGYDAVFALVVENEDNKQCGNSSLQKVEEFWQNYTDLQVCPLLVREDAQGLLISAKQD